MKDTQRIRAIQNRIDDLYKQLRQAMREEFPPNTPIKFEHNGYVQNGITSDRVAYGLNPVVINEKTGKEREVSLYSIIGIGYEIDPEDGRKAIYRPKDI